MLSSPSLEAVGALRVFVVCDQDATAPIWGYIIREKGLVADFGNIRSKGNGTFHGGDSGFDRD